MKKKLTNMKTFKSNFELFDSEGNYYHLDLDGLKGQLTAEEWREDEKISQFDEEGQDRIISSLKTYEYLAD